MVAQTQDMSLILEIVLTCSKLNYIWLAFDCSDWLIVRNYSPVMPTGQSRACKIKAKKHIIIIKKFINLEHLVLTGKSQPCKIDLTIPWSIWQDLSLRLKTTFGQYRILTVYSIQCTWLLWIFKSTDLPIQEWCDHWWWFSFFVWSWWG